jgi:cyclic beta-1,2-glucan synthetase
VALEGILGLTRRGAFFTVDPCIPSSWPSYSIEWRFRKTRYTIAVENPKRRGGGVLSAELDGAPADPAAIPLMDDDGVHRVRVVLGAPPKASRSGVTKSGETPASVLARP